MTDTVIAPEEFQPREKRTRQRRSRLNVKNEEIVDRVCKFASEDESRREEDIEMRNQRYAKYRMWTEGKDWPWPDSSDIALPDMMEACLRMQDTLHNAMMSQSPPLNAKDLMGSSPGKEEKIDRLIEYQFFSEQDGEGIVGTLAENFIVDGVWRTFTPWIKEEREVHETLIFDPIPDDMEPSMYFEALLRQKYQQRPERIRNKDGWDWRVEEDGKPLDISFYTRKDGRVEMSFSHMVIVYDGPRCLPISYERILYPPRCENLQIPSPSNPGGAPHVILIDFPTKSEISGRIKSGYYDLATKDDRDALEIVSRDWEHQESDRLKDDLRGQEGETEQGEDKSQNRVTRYTCFDLYEGQDVIWTVIKETKSLLRARYLTEMYPGIPKRPIQEASCLPVAGRCEGISYLELMEGLHDAMKTILDQTIDGGTLLNAPFFFYRPHGTMKQEVMRLAPGEGYPLGDPSKDVFFPPWGNRDQTFGINMVTLLQQLQEKTTMVGDIQQGRVPPGRSSALRTIGGMALLVGQGESRPERILRRFFMGFTEIWQAFHRLNEHYLPEDKKIRIAGTLKPGEDPYQTISDRSEISGVMRFDFKANVLNTSKEALQQSLMQLGQVYFTELGFQAGTVDVEGFYRWKRDLGNAFGQDPDHYIKAPSPEAMMPRIYAEEAIQEIMHNGMPEGAPAEPDGWMGHLNRLGEFAQGDAIGLLTPEQAQLFGVYAQKVQERVVAQQKQMAIAQAAANQQQGGGQGGRPPEQPPVNQGNPPVQQGELLNETLPGAGGGGQI